jgi:subtilisin family serine protease
VGTHLGGHDGYSVFEEYLSRVSHQSGVVICCAAGNEGAAARHMSGVIAKADDIQKIEISVGPRSPDVYVSLWNAAPDRVSVAVTSPTGEMVGRVPARNGASVSERLVFERSTVQVYYFFPIEGSGSQLTVVKILAATAGLWTILAHGDIITDGRFDAWLPIAGFADPEVRFLSPSPDSTVVVPGSADGMLTCGSFNARTLGLAATSSWGPTRRPELAPDLTAPGEAVPGDFPTGHGELDGTSVAAAVASAACALMLQWGVVDGNEPMMNTYLARAYLIRGCDRSPALTYPNNQWGYGRLNLENTFNLLRRTPND